MWRNMAFLPEIPAQEGTYEMNQDWNQVFCWEFVEYIGCIPNNFSGLRILSVCIKQISRTLRSVKKMRQSISPSLELSSRSHAHQGV